MYKLIKIISLCTLFYRVLLGGIMLSILCFFLLGENNYSNCSIRVYLFNLAFTFGFAPLLIKSWRVHHLFNIRPMTRKTLIKNYVLLLWTFLFVAIDVGILAANLYHRGTNDLTPVTVTKLSTNGAYAEQTYCGYYDNTTLAYSELAYKGCMIVLACYLCFLTRRVVDEIAGSKILLIIVYNTAMIASVIILIVSSLSDIRVIILCEVIGICFIVSMNACLLVLPWLYILATVGDDEATEHVIMSMTASGNIRNGKVKGSISLSGTPVAPSRAPPGMGAIPIINLPLNNNNNNILSSGPITGRALGLRGFELYGVDVDSIDVKA